MQTIIIRQRRLTQDVIPAPKRKFNLVLGLKRCYNDFNNYFGLESASDRILYHSVCWFCMAVIVGVSIIIK